MNEWTIMVYMAGDNNLSLDMAYAVDQIKAITGNTKNLNVYVYFDGLSTNVPTLYCDFSRREAKFYRSAGIENKLIQRSKSNSNVFNENSASMNNMLNFVDWCVKRDMAKNADGAKSSKYAFVISGHSFGFMDWGLFKDEKANFTMTLSKLRWLAERITLTQRKLEGLAEEDIRKEKEYAEKKGWEYREWSEEKYKERTQEILGQKLELLGFDSCVMSTLEIGSQFIGLANTMVASEGSVPNAGWNYAQVLLGQIAKKGGTTNEIAMSFVDSFIKAQNNFALADLSVDIAAWDLTKLPRLNAKFALLADSLLNCFKEENGLAYQQMKRVLSHVHWQCQTYLYEQHVDLGDFCELLASEISLLEKEVDPESITQITEVRERCSELSKELLNVVLLSGYSGGDFQYSHGISLFFPWSRSSYDAAKKDYKKLSFICDPETGGKWAAFLEEYLGKVTFRRAAALSPTDQNGDVIVKKGTNSIRYDSYLLLDEGQYPKPWEGKQPPDDGKQPPDDGKQPPDDGKQPPDDGKQPPDDGRQPPDDGRLISGNMSLFLARYMRLKNSQSHWNHAGFTSKHVHFVPDSQNAPQARFEVKIPKGVSIQLTISDIKKATALRNPKSLPAVSEALESLDLSDDATLTAVRKIGLALSKKYIGSDRQGIEMEFLKVSSRKARKGLEKLFESVFPDETREK